MWLKNVVKTPVVQMALKAIFFLFILWAANMLYGLAHEAAHAGIVEALGGQVYSLYVNPLGTNAYTAHSALSGTGGEMFLMVAGLAMTTLCAFLSLFTGYAPLTWFFSLRTTIYSLNYAPGTDLYNLQQLMGSGSMLVSAALVALNLTCALIALKMAFRKPVTTSASSPHARLSNNS